MVSLVFLLAQDLSELFDICLFIVVCKKIWNRGFSSIITRFQDFEISRYQPIKLHDTT